MIYPRFYRFFLFLRFSMAFSLRFLSVLSIIFLSFHKSVADSSVCPRSGVDFFVNGIGSQCSLWIEHFPPEEVSGDKLDRELQFSQGDAYHSILFYASWCPFSRKVQPIFEALSTMFPQLRHLTVEESSTIPSVFSRYGVHSFPSILIANRTARLQYHGPKDLDSLENFYREVTGFDPVAHPSVEESVTSESKMSLSLQDLSLREIVSSEPYLAFSLAFICLEAVVYLFPTIISRIKAFLTVYTVNMNLGIFGEWNHLLERVLHVINLKRIWSKLRLYKTRNFQKGAKNATVWASSLASVSLGESSSSRDS